MTDTSEILTAHNLAAGYKGKVVWQDASFSVSPGDFIGLLGPNGAGKTTLFKLLLGLTTPVKGRVELFGESPSRGNFRVGYVPQRRFVDSESRLEALEYVRLGVKGNGWGFSLGPGAAHERKQALAALKLVDGEALANRSLSELSGGEMQRVFLAQALVSKPDLLLLDEPLANLDIKRGSQLIKLVDTVVKKEGLAAMLIAHDINPLLPVINRIIYIANGKVVSGRPDEIVNSKTLSKLYGASIEVLKDSKGRLAVLGVEEALHHDE